MSYRDTAFELARRAAGNFIGVVLYVPAGGQSKTPWWSMSEFPNSAALEDWYDEISAAPLSYYYVAAFDKARDSVPVGEAVAPPKPGTPGFVFAAPWQPPPFKRPAPRPSVSGETRGDGPVDYAKTVAIFALFAVPAGLLLSKRRERKHLRDEKAAFGRLGLDWNQRFR